MVSYIQWKKYLREQAFPVVSKAYPEAQTSQSIVPSPLTVHSSQLDTEQPENVVIVNK